jgi:indolepyruvate ferredoxin oxidoreductase
MSAQPAAAVAGVRPRSRTESFSLDDRYRNQDGTIYLSGVQALVRVLLDRAREDRRRGRDVAQYVSGYEGSPLAGYDLELARQHALLTELGIVHQPGLNEELAATAVSGTQLAGQVAALRHDGVTGIWYGKAPGLDRATDAIRHANLTGTSALGGAVALVGDDPTAKSSTVPSASEAALAALALPTLCPADPAEVLVHGQHAIELSRASGLWTAIKMATNVADGWMTAQVGSPWQSVNLDSLPGGLRAYQHRPSARLLGSELAELEAGQQLIRLPIAVEYIRRSGLNEVIGRGDRIGIVASGKTHLDVRQALSILGLRDTDLERYGIRLLKLGAVYPLEASIVREFARGLRTIVVVEDKGLFLEDAIKSVLYGQPDAPPVHGKLSPDGSVLFSRVGELDPDRIAAGLAGRLLDTIGELEPVQRWLDERAAAARAPRTRTTLPITARAPYFCSGCPHNSSTKVADGTLVGGGIGCHAMVLLMPEKQAGTVVGLAQMGGEGAQWIGMAPFVTEQHFVQNIGDGTFIHSGSLAVRAAVAAGVNVTFKLLHNSAVAMTGGQQVMGELPLDRLVDLLRAEGVARVVVTSDQPQQLRKQLPRSVEVHDRSTLLTIAQELASVPGVTVLIHDQECAAEKRRKRRRGKAETPQQRVMINERVCEGCGDCGSASNCLSVEPVGTEYGRKTRINQSSCNVDYSCLAGDCPSFLTVVPGTKTRRQPIAPVAVPQPTSLFGADGVTVRIAGVGGTGVVTIAQILATAAVLDGKQVRALDQTGLAQKGGAVLSDLTITATADERGSKLMAGGCDLYLGCDSLVAGDATNLQAAARERTVAVVSTAEVPTGHMVVDPSVAFPAAADVMSTISSRVRAAHFLDARAVARAVFDDEQYANMILVGAAYQVGALPLSSDAIESAIRVNGTAVEANLLAFGHGRQHAAEQAAAPDSVESMPQSVEMLVAERAAELVAYQDDRYAAQYVEFVERVRRAEAAAQPGHSDITAAVGRNLFKLMAYKDEYEVARLSLDPALDDAVAAQFGGGARYSYRLHPPVLRAMGMSSKISLGPWFRPALRVLRALRPLRGTRLDVFGYAEVRRVERSLIPEYRATIEAVLAELDADPDGPGRHARAVQIAELPDLIRGYEQIKLRNVAAYRARLAELLASERVAAS